MQAAIAAREHRAAVLDGAAVQRRDDAAGAFDDGDQPRMLVLFLADDAAAGSRARISARIARPAPWPAAVTGSKPCVLLFSAPPPARKCGRMAAAATSASSSAKCRYPSKSVGMPANYREPVSAR
jgi:hypothetical protein